MEQMLSGRYQVEEKIGADRFGDLFRVTDLQARRLLLLHRLNSVLEDERFEEDKLFEALRAQVTTVQRLNHPNILALAGIDRWDGSPVLLEEFPEGATLEAALEEGTLAAAQTMEIALDVTRALEVAHANGIVHGYLSPAFVIVTKRRAMVRGFGLAPLLEGCSLSELDFPLFPTCLAPEQLEGEALEPWFDLYALGGLLYRLFSDVAPDADVQHEALRLRKFPSSPALEPLLNRSRVRSYLISKLLSASPRAQVTKAEEVRRILAGTVVRSQARVHRQRKPLVGRALHLKSLLSVWDQARAGHGQLVFISGDPGSGKTALAHHVAVESHAPIVLTGYCREQKGAPAYLPFLQILRSYFSTLAPESLDDELRQLSARLSSLLPEIREILPDLPRQATLDPAQEKSRLLSSLVLFIYHQTQTRPWLVILENLQWADPGTLELLQHLGRHLSRTSILLIGTYRDSLMTWRDPLQQTMDALSRNPGYRHFPLEPLSQAEVRELLSHLWQRSIPGSLVNRIYTHTRGNPFYVEEVAKWMVDTGAVQQDLSLLPGEEDLDLPGGVHETVWRRIEQLEPEALSLLQKAAVLGESFRFKDLHEMSGYSEEELLERLLLLLERHMLREAVERDHLEFSNAEVRNALYSELDLVLLRRLHRQAGEALERRAELQPILQAEEMAHHFTQAGELEKALRYSAAAGRLAQDAYANESALLWYQRALDTLESLGEEAAERFREVRLSIYEAMGRASFLLGRNEEAAAYVSLALKLLEELFAEVEDPDRLPELARFMARLHYQQARIQERLGAYDRALAWIESGLGYLDERQPVPEWIRLHVLSGWIHFRLGHLQQARTTLERYLDDVQTMALHSVESEILRILGLLSFRSNKLMEALSYLERSLHIAQQIGDRYREAQVMGNLGVITNNLSRHAQARVYHEVALEIAREISDRETESKTLLNLGPVVMTMNDYAAARKYAEQALDLFREQGSRLGILASLNNLGVAAAMQCDYGLALDCFEEVLQISREIKREADAASALQNLGHLFTLLGNYERAATSLEEALEISHTLENQRCRNPILIDLSRLECVYGRWEQAVSYAQEARDFLLSLGRTLSLVPAFLSLGVAYEGLDRWDDAEENYRRALELQVEVGVEMPRVESLAGLARVALARGDADAALACAEEIFTLIEDGNVEGLDDPFPVYWTWYRALRRAGDPRARQILAHAYGVLRASAEKLDAPQLRHAFLKNVALHWQIVETFEKSAR